MKNQLYLLLLLALPTQAKAQQKALGQPTNLERPQDRTGPALEKTLNGEDRRKSNETPWLVVSDRDDNPVFDAPNGFQTGQKLGFRDWFYVVGEQGAWIKIAKASIRNGLKIEAVEVEIGWVPKANMLLWTSALTHPASKVQQKAFLFDWPDEENGRPGVQIFRGPNTAKKAETKNTPAFCFVLKKENGKYLLCRESSFSRKSVGEIVGWARQQQCADWGTRLCLEPNFSPGAFDERKNRPELRAKAFKDRSSAEKHFKTGQADPSTVAWDRDPAAGDLPENQLSKTNPRRFGGAALRFPLLGIGDLDAAYENVYRSWFFDLSPDGQTDRAFREVFLPKRVQGAAFPAFSCMVFMSKEEARDYAGLMKNCATPDFENLTAYERRKLLHKTYLNLISHFAGDDAQQKERLENGDLNDLLVFMHGAGTQIRQDIRLSTNVRIAELPLENLVSDQKVLRLLGRFEKVFRFFNEEVLRKEDKYPFLYSAGGDNDYYWIPIEDTF